MVERPRSQTGERAKRWSGSPRRLPSTTRDQAVRASANVLRRQNRGARHTIHPALSDGGPAEVAAGRPGVPTGFKPRRIASWACFKPGFRSDGPAFGDRARARGGPLRRHASPEYVVLYEDGVIAIFPPAVVRSKTGRVPALRRPSLRGTALMYAGRACFAPGDNTSWCSGTGGVSILAPAVLQRPLAARVIHRPQRQR